MNIWVNGCFDILHTGHIDLLWYAKLYGTKDMEFANKIKFAKTNQLFVGVDSDDRVKMLKGDSRPINNVYYRVVMLGTLKMVDSVVFFHDDDELRYFIKKFNIDYMVIGNQYKDKVVIGAECAKSGVIYYPTDERSSTNIIEKIKKETQREIFEEMLEKFSKKDDVVSMNFHNYAVGKLNRL